MAARVPALGGRPNARDSGAHGVDPTYDAAVADVISGSSDGFSSIELGVHVGFLLAPDRGELRGDLAGLVTFRDVRDIDTGHDA